MDFLLQQPTAVKSSYVAGSNHQLTERLVQNFPERTGLDPPVCAEFNQLMQPNNAYSSRYRIPSVPYQTTVVSPAIVPHFSFNLLLYGGVSLVHGLLSRIVMTKFFFDYPIVLIMFHMALTLGLIELGRLIKLLKVQPYTFYRGKDMFVPSLFYALSQYIMLNCLDGITLPFFPFLQKFFALLVVPCYVLFLRRRRPSVQTLMVLFLLCVGTAMSSVFELNLDLWGLLYSVLSLVMLTVSLVLMERLSGQQGGGSSALELIYMNSFNCLCLFLIADIVQDEIRDAYMYMQTSTTPVFYLCLLCLIIVGALCHAVLVHCITTANTLNTAVVHNCSSAIQVLVAYALSIEIFYDSEPNWNNIFGVMLALAATVFYFLSDKDRELKPQGHSEAQQGAKYRLIAQS